MNEAKNKAQELIEKFLNKVEDRTQTFILSEFSAITCALILVNELLEAQPSYQYWNTYDDETPSAITFWNEVKTELEARR